MYFISVIYLSFPKTGALSAYFRTSIYFSPTGKFFKETLSDHDGSLAKFEVSTWSPYSVSSLSGRMSLKSSGI
jgi:hypothetical protein